MTTDNEKQTLLKLKNNGALKLYGIYKRECFLSELNPDPQFCFDTYPDFFSSIEEVLLCARYSKNYYNRNTRLTKKIEKLITDYDEPVFITLTFNDSSLDFLSYDTRRKRVREWLKSQGSLYVANVDYGKENGREHYHAIINKKVDPLTWSYGSCNVKLIFNKNCKALAKYINKLTNHALKDTANRGARIIYSRGLKI